MNTIYVIVENCKGIDEFSNEDEIYECLAWRFGYFTDEKKAEAKCARLNKEWRKERRKDILRVWEDATVDDLPRFGYIPLKQKR
jgi:hypothetical protein